MTVVMAHAANPIRAPAAKVDNAISAARRELAAQWLALHDQEVQGQFSGRLGGQHRLIAGAGLRDLPVSTKDHATLDALVAAFAAIPEGQARPGVLLAAMLFLYPHQLPRMPPLPAVPAWLLADYQSYMLSAPSLFREQGEAQTYAEFATAWAHAILNGVRAHPGAELWRNATLQFTNTANFVPLYFNSGNLRDAMETRAALFETSLAMAGRPLAYTPPARQAGSRLRLGVLAHNYSPQTETYAMLPYYRDLDREKFEVVLLAVTRTNHPLELFCARHAEQFVALPPSWEHGVEVVRQANLDLLLFATNATAVTNQIALMSVHRMARVQIASVCSCVTTGTENVDAYLSGRLSEPEGAQAHYTEKLFLVDGPAHCYDFGNEPSVPMSERLTRDALGIPAAALVFGSGSNFYKLLPEVEDAWMRVLSAVPGSRLILYPFNTNWSPTYPIDAFMARLGAAMQRHEIASERVIVLGAAPTKADVLGRLRLCDIYLDSFPFSGATSLLDPLEVGLPPVVMDGNNFRGLVGPALMRSIALDDLIASDVDAYVALASKLASDAELRRQTLNRVQEKMRARPPFLDTKLYGARIGAALEQIWREHESGALARWKSARAKA